MNIVHLQLSGEIGGISVLTKEIAKISEHNNIFYFVFERGCISDEIAKDNTVHIQNGRHFDFIGEAVKFTEFCKKHNADVMISHSGAPIVRFLCTFAKKALGKKVKFILYWHSNGYDFFYKKNKIKNIIQKYIEKTAFKTADSAVAISCTVRDSFADLCGFDKNKITVIYNGIDLDKFSFSPRKEHDVFNIIYVGRLFPKKGVHLLIKAMSFLSDAYKVHLDIVGSSVSPRGNITDENSDEYGKRLKELVEKYRLENKISLCGAQTNVEEWLAKSSLFVHPAILQEGFGITLAEAMACGVPCLAFDKGAMREIIENGKNGFIAEDATAECLAQYIKKLYEIWDGDFGKYMKMCAAARETAVKFSIEETKNQLESLYN